MRIGGLAEIRRRPRPGLVPAGGVSLDAQVSDFFASLSGPRLWLDPSSTNTRFQDAAGSSLVTSDGQSFARLNDRSGAGNHVGVSIAASMPTWRTDGALSWAQADGVDDFWQSLSSVDLSGTNKATVVLGALHGASNGAACLYGLGGTATLSGSFETLMPQDTTGAYRFGMGDGSVVASRLTGSNAAPRSVVIVVEYDKSQPTTALQIKVSINGATPTLTDGGPTNSGGSNFLNAVLNFFRRNGATNPFLGRLYGFQLVGRLLSASEISLLSRYMASKTGISF